MERFVDYLYRPAGIKMPAFFALILISILSYLLNGRGVIFTNTAANDLFILLDGFQRVSHQQIPYIDFSTGLGSLNFYGPFWFSWLSNDGGLALLLFNTAVAVYLLVILIYISATRLNKFLSILSISYVALLIMSPYLKAYGSESYIFAMLYNRLGWAALLVSSLLVIPPNERCKHIKTDNFIVSAAAASLILFCLHMKATFALSLCALYMVSLLLYPKKLFLLGVLTFLFTLLGLFLIELELPGLHIAYYHELLTYLEVDDAGSYDNLDRVFITNSYEILVTLASLFILVASIYKYSKFEGLRLFVYVLSIIALTTFVLINNFTQQGMHGLFIIFALSVAVLTMNNWKDKIYWSSSKHYLFMLPVFFVVPEILVRLDVMYRYYQEIPKNDVVLAKHNTLDKLLVVEGHHGILLYLEKKHELNVDKYRKLQNLKEKSFGIFQTEFIYVVSNGIEEFEKIQKIHGKGGVVNFDFSNIFNYAMDLKPPLNDAVCYHVGRNVSDDIYPSASKVLGDAPYVSVSKYPASIRTRDFMLSVYSDYLDKHYEIVSDSTFWTFYKRI